MILTSDIAEKIIDLAETPDELLPSFQPMERAVIIAIKAYIKKDEGAAQQTLDTRAESKDAQSPD